LVLRDFEVEGLLFALALGDRLVVLGLKALEAGIQVGIEIARRDGGVNFVAQAFEPGDRLVN
jgi:hypothetical protein